ncbi:Fic family protein [Thiothrix subterranea]|uniref:Protein adenylyltransferase n=1 Tax=Thiothrix subterranea TaxID=2735563 RepID=A0AA51QY37_9GAMM|nr:Fic family protein [Thiothrix subterranea]MDQ5768336.1 Fic family protein [Thiothrix subterranea]WML87863.1 Fic family protein [Thiothrix subterranea]
MQLASLTDLLPQMETPAILKALVAAHRHLAELKGIAKTIPNQEILLSTLSLQEAQDSSAIENIITTQDALFKYRLQVDVVDVAAKEVSAYADGLSVGYQRVREHGLLTLNTIIAIQETLEQSRAGLRKVPGTVLRNERTGEVVFAPPSPETLPALMSGFEYLLHDEQTALDPLIKMALIHHQFETIHPFYDGNGRTGRIINILYLVKEGLLDSPVLYLSRYINHTKADYYRLLQQVRDTGEWQEWVIYMLRGIASTAKHTITLVEGISVLLQQQKHHIRRHHRFYSQDLINNIFRHPYTKVQFLEHDLNVSRATATRYLDALAQDGVLEKHKLGRENYYLNKALVDLLFNIPKMTTD